MPNDAPSRSVLKLAEAFDVFLTREEQERLLGPGVHAVDLGAAPGGWTWQLIHRGLNVMAIDNGPLKGELVDNALVKHLRVDGFGFKPRKPVDWLTCDMAAQPSRIARLVAEWIATRQARHAIFNLKLPMKKRYEEVEICEALMRERLQEADVRFELRFRQLYHDREEITGFCRSVSTRRARR
jgi:23S rRNA (cytidine2498-2'-O)-methyltransferase